LRFNTPVSIIFASLAKCTTNILPTAFINLCMVEDPKEFQNLSSSLIMGEGLSQKTGDKLATDSIAIDHILVKKSEVGEINSDHSN
jgi:hypothetical protein